MKNRCLLAVVALCCTATLSTALAQELPLAQPAKPAVAKPAETPVAKPAVRPLSANVELTRGNPIEGTLTDTTQLQMKTSFGAIEIPLSEVAGVRFATAEEATTTVIMLNGDSVTGATNVERMTVETEWGVAQINGSAIAGILLVPNLEWSSYDGLNGKRWSLVEKKAAASSAAGTPTTRPFNPQSRGTIIRN
ncbi:hypothetical protein [Roseimaritima ulvae]|uniref:Uncharacterized protein n=1 Tax=Roseimaritima ulvae TaxID=980254 RepID=A0A5B9R9Z0_9BACT|nr:hypothetical protein [Roseimaritima ulvae]QEG43683.1 hypothetical protein UC8_57350 [Roseimaritima ulvae]